MEMLSEQLDIPVGTPEIWTRGEVSGAISMRVSETSEENIWSERRRELRKNPQAIQCPKVM